MGLGEKGVVNIEAYLNCQRSRLLKTISNRAIENGIK